MQGASLIIGEAAGGVNRIIWGERAVITNHMPVLIIAPDRTQCSMKILTIFICDRTHKPHLRSRDLGRASYARSPSHPERFNKKAKNQREQLNA